MDFDHKEDAGRCEERYAYMFKSGSRRFLFVRNFGAGIESVAQLVEDVDTGENLIRKVSAERLRPNRFTAQSLAGWRPKKPREVRILELIKGTFRAPDTEFPCRIVQCYGHEYFKSADTDRLGRPKYHSVSYWKLCNGSSVREQWLRGEFVPPVTAAARMIRQVFSTLHYIYTAGEHPIYHDDLHFGNIWIHWRADQLLPDFYLGDFGNAGVAEPDPKYEDLYLEANAYVARPVDDLDKFVRNLALLLDVMGGRRGYGDPGHKALRRLAYEIDSVIVRFKDAAPRQPPPDLRPFIDWALDIEESFREGAEADETLSDAYIKWITDERDAALSVERERALVVHTTKEEALRSRCRKALASGFESVPVAIHGPWHLVKVEWVLAEEEDTTHHRPNAHRLVEELSKTERVRGQIEPGFLVTDNSPAGVIDDASLNLASTADSASPPDSSNDAQEEAPSPTFSWTEGDDAGLQAEPSRRLSYVLGDEIFATYLSSPQAQYNNLDNAEAEDSDLFHDRCKAYLELDRLAKAAEATRSSKTKRKNASTVPTVVVHPPEEELLERFDERLRLWHALLHEPKCACPEEVWTAGIEATLRSEKVRGATRRGLKHVRVKPVSPFNRMRHRGGVLTYRRG
jgi:tmRNA-binding protein